MKSATVALRKDLLVISTSKNGVPPGLIVGLIQAAGCSCSEIAEQENVTRSFVSKVIHGTKKSSRIAYAIADVIDIPTERLWPGDYKTAPAFQKQHAKAANE